MSNCKTWTRYFETNFVQLLELARPAKSQNVFTPDCSKWVYHLLMNSNFYEDPSFDGESDVAFLPEASFGLRVLSLPASVCVSVRNSTHVQARITKFAPCKRPWLRSLLFWGVIDLDLQGQIYLKIKKLPYFDLVHAIIHHLSKIRFPNLDQ